ncbi:VOC family protein [candidate division WOR-3 bacterium]|uniref:VOC family protein n=1 Tax=candidate division WOR-3 bacterium TaxID=2052148 RepID=A0A9D5KAL6_UNCW3|nr:VOC family protein [candidate division WOR-3 bacterium]MBD3365583.1 VOC family protein [candidate division WOR-3 bacterium]
MTKEIQLGRFEYCLNVKDVHRSLDFYKKLGFEQVGGNIDENWVIIEHGNCILGLYQGHIKVNLLNFRGGDVYAIAEHLKSKDLELVKDAFTEEDGSAAAEIRDPDGNCIYFNTFPGEEI